MIWLNMHAAADLDEVFKLAQQQLLAMKGTWPVAPRESLPV